MSTERVSVTIRFHSGQSQTFTCTAFEFGTTDASFVRPARVTRVKWENADPQPRFIRPATIESIWTEATPCLEALARVCGRDESWSALGTEQSA